MYGACGVANRSAPCLKDGKCSERFPKAFSAVTTTSEDGYPLYRRRNDDRAVNMGGARLDNRWVVPYNPFYC